MLTLKDLAQYFGVSPETARKIARKPGFPLFRSERTLRIPKAAFLAWLAHETRHGED
jgi:excisionase family DNA binding protein